MKRILIVNSNLQLGGIQKALVNMLSEIKDEYKIDLLLFDEHGKLAKDIPDKVSVINTNNFLRILGLKNKDCKNLGFTIYAISSILRTFSHFFGNKIPINILINSVKLNSSYDLAISYMQPGNTKFLYGGCAEFVLSKVTAAKKVIFIHCDYTMYPGNELNNTLLINHFDEILCVSKSCAARLSSIDKIDSKKIKTVYNFSNFRMIKELSNAYNVLFDSNTCNFVSVARLSPEKGICEMIEVFNLLIKRGVFNFKWHIIGGGHLEDQIKLKISQCNMTEFIILHGEKENPYPFIKKATCLIVPSLHEAAPMVFEEAACLYTPIVSTATCSARELVEEKGYGIVVESFAAMGECIENIIKHPECLKKYKKKLEITTFDNKKAKQQLNSVIGEY